MKFTAQQEYGLRCVLHLARAASPSPGSGEDGTPPATMNEVAAGEGVSEQYVGKLFRILARAGLVESARGCRGGYRLTRAPQEIPVGEVLAALGGRLYEPSTCERYRGNRPFCVHTNDCSIRSLWAGLQLIVDSVLSRTSLHDLVASERSMDEWMRKHIEALVEQASEDPSALLRPPVRPVHVQGPEGVRDDGAADAEKSPARPGARTTWPTPTGQDPTART